ncbi:MAG: glycoside hydrolase family 31 protein [Calditrichaeota bacterium]|nr:glycoside hydrolase family 31 protein [Calditrichota bacterium]
MRFFKTIAVGIFFVISVASVLADAPQVLRMGEYSLHITPAPFHIKMMRAGKTLFSESASENGRSSLFYETENGRQVLTGLKAVRTSNKHLFSASYFTSDHRTAEITVKKGTAGEFVISLSIQPSAGVKKCGEVLQAFPEEHYTGLMERVRGTNDRESWQPGIQTGLDLRGEKVSFFVRPTVAIYTPFYLSSKGYGLWVETTWPGAYDLAATNPEKTTFSFEGEGRLVYHIFPGPQPATILENYTALAGRPFLPPKWAFSTWRWRDDHANLDTLYDGTPYSGPINSQLYEDVAMMDSLDIPYGVYWVDRPWAKGPRGYSDFQWDPKRFPNAEKMIRWLHQKHKKFMLWIAPWVMGNMVDEGIARHYFMPGMDRYLHKKRPDRYALIDFTNPDAVRWWQSYLQKIIDQGVAGFKLDRSEEIVPASLQLRVHDGRTTREIHDIYPLLYVKATYEIIKKRRGKDFVLMPRAGYTGSAVYGTFWGGDTGNKQWGLRSAIINVQRASLMGFPIWGSDTGGYHKPTYREVLARWLAFSCFTPIMEVGPTDNRAPWSMRFAPHYDVELIAIWRMYAKLHTALMDYSLKYATEAHKTGHPLVRPLIYYFPEDAAAWKNWEEFFYGEDFLVKPIWRKNQTQTSVYLPRGEWVDYWNPSKTFSGPRTLSVDVPLYKMPIFVRKGARVPMLNLNDVYKQSLTLARKKPKLNGNPKLW